MRKDYHIRPAFDCPWSGLSIPQKIEVVALFVPAALLLRTLEVAVWLDRQFEDGGSK